MDLSKKFAVIKITIFSGAIMVEPVHTGLGTNRQMKKGVILMVTALLTTLGILLGIFLFFVIVGVGFVEVIHKVFSSVAKKKDKE